MNVKYITLLNTKTLKQIPVAALAIEESDVTEEMNNWYGGAKTLVEETLSLLCKESHDLTDYKVIYTTEQRDVS